MTDEVDRFYKYRSCEPLDRLEQIILGHKVYFPTADELNDPTDCRPKVAVSSRRGYARFLIRQWRRENPKAGLLDIAAQIPNLTEGIETMGDDAYHEHLVRQLHAITRRYRVFSMSKRWDNMSQWAKYGGDHSGVCLQFERRGIFGAARPVQYGPLIELDMTSPNAAVENSVLLFRKTPEWSGEEEVRIVLPNRLGPLIAFDPTHLTALILGIKTPAAAERQIRTWAAARTPPLVIQKASYNPLTLTLIRT
jgi:hypothetical protein